VDFEDSWLIKSSCITKDEIIKLVRTRTKFPPPPKKNKKISSLLLEFGTMLSCAWSPD
jgi:hypothetical protein